MESKGTILSFKNQITSESIMRFPMDATTLNWWNIQSQKTTSLKKLTTRATIVSG